MSYDIHFEMATGSAEPAVIDFDWNYTSNVAPMWRKAMPETDGLAGMDGMVAIDAGSNLRRGIERMEADPDAYRALNPENGWGSFDGGEYTGEGAEALRAKLGATATRDGGQLQMLRELVAQCEQHPAAIVRIWR